MIYQCKKCGRKIEFHTDLNVKEPVYCCSCQKEEDYGKTKATV